MPSVLTTLVAGILVGAATLPGAAELLSSSATPDGYELTSDPDVELDFTTFAEQSPYSVGHIDADSADAAATTASQDVWVFGESDVLLREVVIWPSDDLASGFVGEVSDFAADVGLEATRAPFNGASAFTGADPETGVWVRMVVWSDGRVGATVNHFAEGDDDPGSGDVDATSNSLAAQLASANAATSPNDPLADGGSSGSGGSGTSTSSGGGIPIVTVLFWLAIIGGAIWLFLKLRRKVQAAKGAGGEPEGSEAAADDEDRDVDDIIERARARGRAQQEVDAIPDPSAEWTPPDDY